MRLNEFLAKGRISPEQFALNVGLHPTTIYRLLNGTTIPKRENLRKILAATNGEVDICDLMYAFDRDHAPKEKVRA
jgi:hypothetical protein